MNNSVYIITNPSFPNLIKVGCTTKSAIVRAKQFNNTAVPHSYVAEYEIVVKYNHEELEEKTHRLLSLKWENKEWFRCEIEQALKIIRGAASELNVINEIFYWVDRAKKNAEYENIDAQTELGYAYYKGYGVEQDYVHAKEWFAKAAERGSAKAQNFLGFMCQKGQGIKENIEESKTDKLNSAIFDYVNIQDYKEAKVWYEKSAEQGYIEAQFNLGYLFYEASWIEQDYKKAFDYFLKAAEQNNANAQCYLGKMYQQGHHVSRNLKMAEKWYLKALQNDENEINKKVIQACLGS